MTKIAEKGITPEQASILKSVSKRDLSPKELESILKQVEHSPTPIKTETANFKNYKGNHVKVGIMSDSHIGHECFDSALMKYAVDTFNKEKVNFVIHVGDILEGVYSSRREGHVYELEHISGDSQIERAVKELAPIKAPLYFITGNHEQNTFFRMCGIEVGKRIEDKIPNAKFLGNAEGKISLGKGVDILMLHPDGGSSYSISYRSQKIAESLTGGSKPSIMCFVGDSQVVMGNGSLKEIQNVRVGDEIITHRGNIKKVSDVMSSHHDHEFSIDVFGIPHGRIKCSKEHPFLIKQKDGKIVWKRADQILKTDWLARPILNETKKQESIDILDYLQKSFYRVEGDKIVGQNLKKYNRKIEIDKDFCRLLGLYVAEGYVDNPRYRLCFAINQNEKEYTEFIIKTLKNTFGVNPIIEDRKESKTRVIRVNDMIVADFFASLVSKYASNKDFPDFCLFLDTILQHELLRGLFEGDGCKSSNYFELSTMSNKLIEQVLLISARLGYAAGYSRQTRRNQDGCNRKPENTLRILHKSDVGEKWFNKVIINQTPLRGLIINDGDYVWHHLRKINVTPKKQKMYNLEVEGDHSYLVSSVITHNCIGHFHKMEYLFYRNIHVLQTGTLESQTKFMKGRHLSAHKGFIIADIEFGKEGIGKFSPTFYTGYKDEK